MPCQKIGYAIVCSRSKPKVCFYCGRPSEVLCDYPMTSSKSGTCDKPCCRLCSKRVGMNRDYCLAHAREAEGQQR